jgi:hypothetical protein
MSQENLDCLKALGGLARAEPSTSEIAQIPLPFRSIGRLPRWRLVLHVRHGRLQVIRPSSANVNGRSEPRKILMRLIPVAFNVAS